MSVLLSPRPQAKEHSPLTDPIDDLIWSDTLPEALTETLPEALPQTGPQPPAREEPPARIPEMLAAKLDPVFIYGALRSGTTMFRLMLDQHPKIANPGEVDFLFDHLLPSNMHPSGWRYDRPALLQNRIFLAQELTLDPDLDGLDLLEDMIRQMCARLRKGQVLTLNIHRNLRLVNWIYPDARLIHVLRDPRDVARSSVAMGWAHHLYHAVGHWIEVESDWDCVAPWLVPQQVLTLRYEQLVQTPKEDLRRVCGFLGLPWDGAMLRYAETSTYDAPDASLIAQWKTRCDPDQIALLEGRAGTLVTARGYAVTGRARRPSLVERGGMGLSEKLHLWLHGARVYGAGTFLAEKLTRLARLQGPHGRLRLRMNQVDTLRLK